MPFSVKKNAFGRAIFGGGGGGYRRQKSESTPLKNASNSSTNTPSSSTSSSGTSRMLVSAKLELKRYDILPTRRSSESESKDSLERRVDTANLHLLQQHNNNHNNNQGSHENFGGFPDTHTITTLHPDDDATKASTIVSQHHDRSVEPVVQQCQTGPSTPSYPRNIQSSRGSWVMPTNTVDDDLLSCAFDEIVTRRGEEKKNSLTITLQQQPAAPEQQQQPEQPRSNGPSPVPPSPRDSPVRPRKADPPGTSKSPFSRDPPASIITRLMSPVSSSNNHRADPAGDSSLTFSSNSSRRVIPIVDVSAPTPSNTRREQQLQPNASTPNRRISNFRRVSPVPLNDASPTKYSTSTSTARRASDPEYLISARALTAPPSPPTRLMHHHHQPKRRLSSSDGTNTPLSVNHRPYLRKTSDVENQEFPASFALQATTAGGAARTHHSSYSTMPSQVAVLQQRHVERQAAENQPRVVLDPTVSYTGGVGTTRRHSHEPSGVVAKPKGAGHVPSNASERRLSRHAWRQNQLLEPPSNPLASIANVSLPTPTVAAAKVNKQPLQLEPKQITSGGGPSLGLDPHQHHRAERRASGSGHSRFRDFSSENIRTQQPLNPPTTPQQQQLQQQQPKRNPGDYQMLNSVSVSSVVAAFERGRPRVTSAGSDLPDSSLGQQQQQQQQQQPRRGRGLSDDFSTIKREGSVAESMPPTGKGLLDQPPAAEKERGDFAPKGPPPRAISPVEVQVDESSCDVDMFSLKEQPMTTVDNPNEAIASMRPPLTESRRVLNTEDPNQCTYWVTTADGQCQHLELDVENAIPNKESKKIFGRKEDGRLTISSLWNEVSQHAKGYGKKADKSCLTPSSKKHGSKVRKLTSSLSFRAGSTKNRIRRNFSFSSVI